MSYIYNILYMVHVYGLYMEWNQICIEVEKGVLLNTLWAYGTTFDTQACVCQYQAVLKYNHSTNDTQLKVEMTKDDQI